MKRSDTEKSHDYKNSKWKLKDKKEILKSRRYSGTLLLFATMLIKEMHQFAIETFGCYFWMLQFNSLSTFFLILVKVDFLLYHNFLAIFEQKGVSFFLARSSFFISYFSLKISVRMELKENDVKHAKKQFFIQTVLLRT